MTDRRIMREFRMTEISAVDRPAQKHARAVIMKRDDDGDDYDKRDFSAEERRRGAEEGWAKPDGSYPIRNRGDLSNAVRAWGRGGATASDKAWIIRRAKALGCTDCLPEGWMSKSDKPFPGAKPPFGGKKPDAEDAAEGDESGKPDAEDVAEGPDTKNCGPGMKKEQEMEKIAELEAALAVMAKRATDAEAALAESVRSLEIAKTDETLRIGETEVRKSAVGEATFAMMRAQNIEIAKANEALEMERLTKRAVAEYPLLPGVPTDKALVLKSMIGLPEPVLKALETMLKSGHEALRSQMRPVGHERSDVFAKADDELDALTKAEMERSRVPYAKAQAMVLDTEHGRRLYAEMDRARPRTAA